MAQGPNFTTNPYTVDRIHTFSIYRSHLLRRTIWQLLKWLHNFARPAHYQIELHIKIPLCKRATLISLHIHLQPKFIIFVNVLLIEGLSNCEGSRW